MFVAEAPKVEDLERKLGRDKTLAALRAPVDPRCRRRYLHWEKLKRLQSPPGLSSEQWWLKIRSARSDGWRDLPLTDSEGRPFGYTLPDAVLRSLHQVDQLPVEAIDAGTLSEREGRRRFLVNSLMEEAIRSSQLEGATTSRVEAKELLLSGRRPRDRSEQMIANNYRAIQFMREEMGTTLTPDAVCELQRVLTEGTLDDPSAAGRLQLPGERRVVVLDRDGGRAVHRPPPAEQLPQRMRLLCEFANGAGDDDAFVHPVVRAILLHFWLAYDHPFLDGNGRTARILFFWSMRASRYRLAEYLPISRLIRDAPGKYGRAFLETETDGGDTTYFLLHQLDVIEQAGRDMNRYLARKRAERAQVKELLQGVEELNGRQLVLLTHAIKHPDHTYTFGGHARSNRVTHETARADLGALAERGLLVRKRAGRTYKFEPPVDLPRRLKESDA
ncbi:MAG TPA: Fic family protein [Solirubrobacterales bacterium]|nr:Fic family protein [Solirubrobacterales bacterium]